MIHTHIELFSPVFKPASKDGFTKVWLTEPVKGRTEDLWTRVSVDKARWRIKGRECGPGATTGRKEPFLGVRSLDMF